ncbi:MAG: Peptidoglycan N-acetylglucosamine deacetylase [Firmicutes bacterium]|nr:Peptidoglycan N-acetylglucosamine deacetylase [Bacillota bacterium]
MNSFLVIFIASYGAGLIDFRLEDRRQAAFWTLFKGFICVLLAGMYNHTGLSLLVSTLGVSLGHKWPVTRRFRERDGEMLILGTMLASMPLTGIAAGLIYAALRWAKAKHHLSVMVTSSVTVIAMFVLKRPDSSIFIGMFALLVSLLQFITHLEEIGHRLADSRIFRRRTLLRALSVFLVLSVAVLMFFNRYVYKGLGMHMEYIRNGPRELNYIALTFDDGPDPVYTPQILDVLKEKDVKATFFLVGSHAAKYPEIVKRMHEEGHSIGNHTNSHRSLIPLSDSATYGEIMLAEKTLEGITGEKPTLFRPPRGVYSQFAQDILRQERYTLVLWDVSSQDWEEIKYTDIVRYVLKRVRPGSIVLFHDSGNIITSQGGDRSNTVKALPIIIDRLREQGYQLITVDQMIVLKGLSETEGALYDDN